MNDKQKVKSQKHPTMHTGKDIYRAKNSISQKKRRLLERRRG